MLPPAHKHSRLILLQVTFTMFRPLLPFLDILEPRTIKPLPAPAPGILASFAAKAKEDPSTASAIKVTIHSCTDLVLATHADAAKVYVQYEFPGHAAAVETLAQSGCSPEYEESRTFEFAPHPQSNAAFADALRTAVLRLAVLDAAADGSGETVGIANLALSCAPRSLLCNHADVTACSFHRPHRAQQVLLQLCHELTPAMDAPCVRIAQRA